MALPSFTPTGTIYDIVGVESGELTAAALSNARIVFTPNVASSELITWEGEFYRLNPVVATLDDLGTIGTDVRLLANDPGLNLDGLQWRVQVRVGLSDFVMKPWWFDAPADGVTLDLADVARVPGVAAQGTAGLPEQVGHAGQFLTTDGSTASWTEVVGGGGGSGANLSVTRTSTAVTVASDSGTDAVVAAADGSNAGAMTAAMQTKLAGIATGATANSDASINTLADARVAAGITGKLDTTAAPELIRDTIGTALVAGSNVTITPNDAGDTITVAVSAGITHDGLALVDADGGADYYTKFSYGPQSGKLFFPVGLWLTWLDAQWQLDMDRGAGINTYVAMASPDTTDLNLLIGSGSYALLHGEWLASYDDWKGNPNVWGHVLIDEIDMVYGGAGGDQSAGIADQQAALNALPRDGRMIYANYGKGVAFYAADYWSRRYVNEFADVSSTDVYWMTDPVSWMQYQGGKYVNGSTAALTPEQAQLGFNYSYIVNRTRTLVYPARSRPSWGFVELGHPGVDDESPTITTAQIRSAVWHCIIAGARGIVYFNNSFGTVPDYNVLRNGTTVRAAVTAVNDQIHSLAEVLNSPTVTGFATSSSGIAIMTKYCGGVYYVFAGSKQIASQSATITLSVSGYTTATVDGESRSVSITSNVLTDTFANQDAVHIYRIV